MNKKRIIFVIIVVYLIMGYLIYDNFFNNNAVTVNVVSTIDGYDYKLDDKDTKLFKKYYKELETLLKSKTIDEKEYASLISKLFVIDFYTLDNKVTNKDIGGKQFVSELIRENFEVNASSTIYKYVESDLYSNRKQKLPIVSSVKIESINQEKFKYSNNTDDSAYKVKLSWEYKTDLDYPTSATLTIIHESNKLTIVELN